MAKKKRPERNPIKKGGPIRTKADLEALAVGQPGDEQDLMLGHYAVKHPELSLKELLRRFGRTKGKKAR